MPKTIIVKGSRYEDRHTGEPVGVKSFKVERIKRGVYKFTPLHSDLKPIRVYGSMKDVKFFAKTRAVMGKKYYYPSKGQGYIYKR